MADAVCPGCGDSFPVGGSFNTHVENCESVVPESQDGGVNEEVAERLESIERRLWRLESAFMEYDEAGEAVEAWQNEEIVALWRQVDDVAEAVTHLVRVSELEGMNWEENPFRGPESPPERPVIEIEPGGEEP